MSNYKPYTDNNGVVAYVFDKNEDINLELFGGKRYSTWLIGRYIDNTEVIWNKFTETTEYKLQNEEFMYKSGWKLGMIEGYVESEYGHYYVHPTTKRWTVHPESLLHEDHPANRKERSKRKAIKKVKDSVDSLIYFLGVIIFIYIFVSCFYTGF